MQPRPRPFLGWPRDDAVPEATSRGPSAKGSSLSDPPRSGFGQQPGTRPDSHTRAVFSHPLHLQHPLPLAPWLIYPGSDPCPQACRCPSGPSGLSLTILGGTSLSGREREACWSFDFRLQRHSAPSSSREAHSGQPLSTGEHPLGTGGQHSCWPAPPIPLKFKQGGPPGQAFTLPHLQSPPGPQHPSPQVVPRP